MVILDDDGRAWLTGVIGAAGDRPDLASCHESPSSDIASMKP